MLDIIATEDVRNLVEVASPTCLSFYLSTHASGPGVAEGPIRLKNLIAEAGHELDRLGVRSNDAAELLGPVDALLDDDDLWAHAESGLAVFRDEHGLRRFRLPGPVEKAVLVSDRFWIAPLLPFVAPGVDFFVLALSDNEVRVLRCDRYGADELALDDIPASSAEALRFDDREPQLQSHSARRGGHGRTSAAFHGHDVNDLDDVDKTRFLRLVDHGLREVLGDRSEPLVLAGVEDVVTRFRSLSDQRNIADASILGNPEHLSPKELHERALPLVASLVNAERAPTHHAVGSPATTITDSIAAAIAAATTGRVERLFILAGRRMWGSVGAGDQQVEHHADRRPGDVDLLDVAARETLGNGGDVVALDAEDMPTDGPFAAILRY
ncbi:MAG: hypothetical protein R2707_03555 [Acidimicrobiales bacterium]